MSLKQIAAERWIRLRVARLYARNTQLSGKTRKHGATTAQQTGLKALIANGSACNQTRNHGAITPKTRAFSPLKHPESCAGCGNFFRVARRLHCLKISRARCRKPTRFRTLSPRQEFRQFCHFGQSLILVNIKPPTNRTHPHQREVLPSSTGNAPSSSVIRWCRRKTFT